MIKHQLRSCGQKGLRGFTLIEVLIALTLLSIMVVLLFSSLKICADSWEKGEDKITDVNEIAVVYGFFQRHLSVAQPYWDDFSEEDARTFSFQGQVQSLQFVSSFPASAGRSGLQLFTLTFLEENQDRFIKITLTPFFPATEGEGWHKEEVTLIKHVSEFSLAYFDSVDGAEGTWEEEWLERENLPRLIKINIKLENGRFWPEMIVDLKITGMTDNTEFESAEDSEDQEAPEEPEPEPEVTQ
ncbi:MAG: prepilin-type N-terminal cleavage/methylation domain-containing protein [Methylococcales bacterium]|nr:prepilin-type N-terminal cleavage/methylation domain-containing protein [Methylococcales bacterium]